MFDYPILMAAMPWIAQAPKDHAAIDQLMLRPLAGQRQAATQLHLDPQKGVIGDRWLNDCYLSNPQEGSDPRVQISLLNTRVFQSVCQFDAAVHPGDPIIADIDTSAQNLPIGQRIQIGAAIIEISDVPNFGCPKWRSRYGDDALRWVCKQAHQPLQLRGVLARIIQAGVISAEDKLVKID